MSSHGTDPTPAMTAAEALLAEYGLPGEAPEDQLRAITRVAAALCGTGTAVVNLLGGCFQHQVAAAGFEAVDTPVGDSMCVLAMADPSLRYAPDASRTPGFAANPWVDGRLAEVKLYAAAPMLLPDGRVLGTLCVFSEEAGSLTRAQMRGLADLAGQAVALFEHARLTREAHELARRAQALAADLDLSREQYRLVAEGGSDILSVFGVDGRIEWISPSVQRVLGYDPAGQLGQDAHEGVHPEDQQRLGAAVGETFRLGRTTRLVVRTRSADGAWLRLDTCLTPLTDADGLVRRVHSVARDTTPRPV